jgi:hypothetical protein
MMIPFPLASVRMRLLPGLHFRLFFSKSYDVTPSSTCLVEPVVRALWRQDQGIPSSVLTNI